MTSFPSVDGKTVVRTLYRLGFVEIRVKGSHHFLRHDDGRATVVPVHRKESLGPGLFHKILKDCEITIEEFMEMM